LINTYAIVLTIWLIYGFYCFSQYNDAIKTTNWFIIIAVTYGLINNLLWVYVSKKLNQTQTLKIALLWDSGVHFTAFIVPIFLFGNKIKTHTAIGMAFIFIGVSIVLFYDSIFIQSK
jgi:uncharacterized membrane protein